MKFLFFLFLTLNCSSFQVKMPKFYTEDKVFFSVVGDIMSHQTQIDTAFKRDCKCYNYERVFDYVRPYLKKPDILIGNLETTLPGDPKKFSGYPQFGAPDELAVALKNAGFDILTTSNNHSADKGSQGIDHTISVLEQLKILHLGTYRNEEEYQKGNILYFERNNIRFAMLSYSYSTNGLPIPKGKYINLIQKETIRKDIRSISREKADVILVYYHFGTEYARFPDKYQIEMVNLAFEEGVDIVLGGHPHVLQPYIYQTITDRNGVTKKRLVIYSLGNFVSAQIKRYTNGGMIFNFTVTRIKELNKINFFIEDIHYIPVFVYVDNQANTTDYLVLPIQDYIKNDREPKLRTNSHKQMLEFWNDTIEHLEKNSVKGIP